MKQKGCLDAWQLKILAMALMFCDHLWGTLLPGYPWLTYVGRLAFPIFSFQIVEGFFHTGDRKRYLRRMLLFALLSELPFDLAAEGGWFYPFHQNVLFTFCISLLLMSWLEKSRGKGAAVRILTALAAAVLGFLIGAVTFVDYGGYGVWMTLLFYAAKRIGKNPLAAAVQLIGMIAINGYMIGGLVFPFTFLGMEFEFPEQGFAVLALIPIWLYNGKRRKVSPAFSYACYAFYPLHLLVLGLLAHYAWM